MLQSSTNIDGVNINASACGKKRNRAAMLETDYAKLRHEIKRAFGKHIIRA